MARIAVIIVTHNAEPYLDRCLHALRIQAEKPCLIIVDSGSASTHYLDALTVWGEARLVRSLILVFGLVFNVC